MQLSYDLFYGIVKPVMFGLAISGISKIGLVTCISAGDGVAHGISWGGRNRSAIFGS